MKRIVALALVALFICSIAFAEHVNGYYRKNGTYVNSYERSSPNSTVRDNYSYKGNTNPYTGQTGTNYNRNSPSSEYYGTSNTKSSGSSSKSYWGF